MGSRELFSTPAPEGKPEEEMNCQNVKATPRKASELPQSEAQHMGQKKPEAFCSVRLAAAQGHPSPESQAGVNPGPSHNGKFWLCKFSWGRSGSNWACSNLFTIVTGCVPLAQVVLGVTRGTPRKPSFQWGRQNTSLGGKFGVIEAEGGVVRRGLSCSHADLRQ